MTEPLWVASELAEALQPLEIRATLPDIRGVSIDSRTLVAGDLFIALAGDPGTRFHPAVRTQGDGHDYIEQAAAKGAGAALVSRFSAADIPQILVENTLDGLWRLAAAARQRCRAKVIALTGSSGKTTLKGFLAKALDGYASEGSLNNFWGLPLSMSRMSKNDKVAIFEIGMNRTGEIEPLVKLAKPDVAVVLNVLPVHLEGLGSVEAIAREKLAITAGLNPQGLLIMPDTLAKISDWQGRLLTFGENENADLRIVSEGLGSKCQIEINGRQLSVTVPGGGRHRQMTVAATLAAALAVGCDLELAAQRLATLSVPQGRGNELIAGGVTLIDESYNANPASMQFALQALCARADVKCKYAILGDMLELGESGAHYHDSLTADCAKLAGVWLIGPLMARLQKQLPRSSVLGVANAIEAFSLAQIAQVFSAGDAVLVKGSNKVFWQNAFVARLAAHLEDFGPQVRTP